MPIDRVNVIRLHGSNDESRVSTDDGRRGGSSRPRRHRHPVDSETQIQTVVDHDRERQIDGPAIGGLRTLSLVRRHVISTLRRPDEWTETEVTADSGACVSVMPVGICEGIEIFDNEVSRVGAEYEVANGATIPNLGEGK